MTEFEEWLSRSFRRRGPDLAIGPIRHAHRLAREDVDTLIDVLAAIMGRLPTLEQRLAGLSTCETCEGLGIVHGIDAANEYDCPVCGGEGFAPKKGEDF